MMGPTNASTYVSNSLGKYTIMFNEDNFSTGRCFTYADDCSGMEPLDNSRTTGSTVNENIDWGSWQYMERNPMLNDMFYATIAGDGTILHRLNPYDLSKAIDGTDVSTEITQENVMLVIPTRYITRTSNRITHSRNPADGSPDAHTIGGHTYKYLAIGVYPSVNVSSVAKSIAGSKPSASTTRTNFRTYSKANGNPTNGVWLQWNWHQYSLIRDLQFFATLDMNSQGKIGGGNLSGGNNTNWVNNGVYNANGIFAGTSTTGAGVGVKGLIENMWGECWQFIDDVVTGDEYADNGYIWKDLWAGQNVNPTITEGETDSGAIVTSDKVNLGGICIGPNTGNIGQGWKYAKTIGTTSKGWGIPKSQGGSTSSYTFDGYYVRGVTVTSGQPTVTTARNFLVGGASIDGPSAGVSALALHHTVTASPWGYGSRLAFVFD